MQDCVKDEPHKGLLLLIIVLYPSLPDQVCGPEEVEKCRWVVRNENKQVEENVCNFVDKKVS